MAGSAASSPGWTWPPGARPHAAQAPGSPRSPECSPPPRCSGPWPWSAARPRTHRSFRTSAGGGSRPPLAHLCQPR
eukprot:11198241-Lingulodinium_polyedra.AAC.1